MLYIDYTILLTIAIIIISLIVCRRCYPPPKHTLTSADEEHDLVLVSPGAVYGHADKLALVRLGHPVEHQPPPALGPLHPGPRGQAPARLSAGSAPLHLGLRTTADRAGELHPLSGPRLREPRVGARRWGNVLKKEWWSRKWREGIGYKEKKIPTCSPGPP